MNHPRANAVEGDVDIVKELKEWTSNNWQKTATVKDNDDMKVNISGQSCINANDKKRFMEMGMLSLSLVAWVDSNGEFKVQAHNSMVFLKDSQKDTFTERNTNFMNEMLRKFLEYIFYLHDIVCVAPNIGGATTAISTGVKGVPAESPQQGTVGTDSHGYPQLPNAILALTKDLVKLCREYMNAQKPDSQMCVADVCENPSSFIASGCLPKDWDMTGSVWKNSTKKILWDPQNMDKGMLLDLFEHWRLREKAHGCAMALRFTHFMRGKEHLPTMAPPAQTHSTMVSPWKKPTMNETGRTLDISPGTTPVTVLAPMFTLGTLTRLSYQPTPMARNLICQEP
ncbi:hypothetical protein DXG01_002189 [Tephrocybe rancida]|nr:hypothetical protein DXG01_002189 [Tephrocybe rancida]